MIVLSFQIDFFRKLSLGRLQKRGFNLSRFKFQKCKRLESSVIMKEKYIWCKRASFMGNDTRRNIIVCTGISLPPSPPKKHPLFLANPSPPHPSPLNLQTVQAPFLRQSLLYIVFCDPPPPKNWIFQWTRKILKFFILNAILPFTSN